MNISEVKASLNQRVLYNGTEYILTGCTIRRNEKTQEFFYQAEIADIKARSVLITKLTDIKAVRP